MSKAQHRRSMDNKPSAHSANQAPPTDIIIDWFRAASPYINAHRGKTLVLALPGQWLSSELLPTLTHDLTLLSHLGLRLVVCFGLRAQVNEELARDSKTSDMVAGRRVTDKHALRAIIEAAGITRNTLESQLSMGLPNTPMAGARLSVSSGNYVTAQPFGVHDGVDFQHTGSIREIHAEAISTLLDAGHLVLLPPLGYSVTGDVFNITVNELASACAVELNADKLVFLVDELPLDNQHNVLRQASASRLEKLAASSQNHRSADASMSPKAIDSELDSIVPHAIVAVRQGVKRVHLLRNEDRNALLCELYTRDGSGTLITANQWEHIRAATINDVGGIIELIEPLQANGSLVNRSREQLELDIEHFIVSERDGTVVACAAMYSDDDSGDHSGDDSGDHLNESSDAQSHEVEFACIATHPDYRGEGRADQLLAHLENLATQQGFTSARVLSTRTGHWFVERGYVESAPEKLPSIRRSSYNVQRNSKVYKKSLAQ